MAYKNIVCFMSYGRWYADYVDESGKRFALHRCSCKTKDQSVLLAKCQVDYLNYMNRKAR